jgi:hypothetical protein
MERNWIYGMEDYKLNPKRRSLSSSRIVIISCALCGVVVKFEFLNSTLEGVSQEPPSI